jgi:hypothetical protein
VGPKASLAKKNVLVPALDWSPVTQPIFQSLYWLIYPGLLESLFGFNFYIITTVSLLPYCHLQQKSDFEQDILSQ